MKMLSVLKKVANNPFGTECLVYKPNKLSLGTFVEPGSNELPAEHMQASKNVKNYWNINHKANTVPGHAVEAI